MSLFNSNLRTLPESLSVDNWQETLSTPQHGSPGLRKHVKGTRWFDQVATMQSILFLRDFKLLQLHHLWDRALEMWAWIFSKGRMLKAVLTTFLIQVAARYCRTRKYSKVSKPNLHVAAIFRSIPVRFLYRSILLKLSAALCLSPPLFHTIILPGRSIAEVTSTPRCWNVNVQREWPSG